MNERFKASAKPLLAPKTETQSQTSALLNEVTENTQRRYDAGRFAPNDARELRKLAEEWYFSGLLPEAYYPPLKSEKNPNGFPYEKRWEPYWKDRGAARAEIVMRYGASLGVLPEQSIRSIYIVEGQPSPSAALMLALCISSGALRRDDYQIVESTAAACVIHVFTKTRDKPEIVRVEYTQFQHLHNKLVWKQYPADMLFARAVSRMGRRYFPDMFAGVYAAEERADFVGAAHEETIERILASANMPDHAEPSREPEAAPTQSTSPAPTYEELVAEVEKSIELLGATPGDKDLRAYIERLAVDLKEPERSALAAKYKAAIAPRAS